MIRRLSNTVSYIALVIVSVTTAVIWVFTYFYLQKLMTTHCPDLWEFINRDSNQYTPCESVICFILAFIFVVVLYGITFGCFAILLFATCHLLGRHIAHSFDRYPKSYSINHSGYTNDDRRNSTQLAFAYYHAYTVKIELSFEEVQHILNCLRFNSKVYYNFPKSFLMPDNVSWLWPRISLHTVRCIAREIEKGGIVLLTYKYAHPKKDSIRRTDAIVRIIGNLQHDTYASDDVSIGFVNRN